jgi:hypothetical protein
MKAVMIITGFVAVFILFWLVSTPITVFKLFVEALSGEPDEV